MANLYLFSIDEDSQWLVGLTKKEIERVRKVVDRFNIPLAISPIELISFEKFVKIWRTFDMPETGRDDISAADLFEGRISF